MAADRITVVRDGFATSVVVDGVEIPARAIALNSLTAPVSPDTKPTITLTLIAHDVHIANTTPEGNAPHGTTR